MSVKNAQHGFAMIEVLVTAVIIAIGVSGLGILLMRVIQGTQDSAQQSQAMWIVQDYVGRIRANSEGARRRDYVLSDDTDCSTPPAAICAEYYKNGSEVAAVACSAPEMAEFDKWITVCGISSNIFDSPSDFVTNPKLSSSCTLLSTRVSTDSGFADCVQYDVNLEWDTQIKKGSSVDANRIQKNSYSMVVELN